MSQALDLLPFLGAKLVWSEVVESSPAWHSLVVPALAVLDLSRGDDLVDLVLSRPGGFERLSLRVVSRTGVDPAVLLESGWSVSLDMLPLPDSSLRVNLAEGVVSSPAELEGFFTAALVDAVGRL